MDKLFSFAINEWLNDIRKNQLPGLLSGVGPIHSLVQLGEWAGQAGRTAGSGVQTSVSRPFRKHIFTGDWSQK